MTHNFESSRHHYIGKAFGYNFMRKRRTKESFDCCNCDCSIVALVPTM